MSVRSTQLLAPAELARIQAVSYHPLTHRQGGALPLRTHGSSFAMIASFRTPLFLIVATVALPGCRAAWPFAVAEPAVTETTVAAKAATEPESVVQPTESPTEESQASFTSPATETVAPTASLAVPAPTPTAEQAFAQVLGDIEELGRTDPDAQRQLLKQLQSAKPAHYALVVQQFKAAYAYSRELRQRSRPEPLPVDLPPVESSPIEPASRSDETQQPRFLPEPLGKLDDPRAVRKIDETPQNNQQTTHDQNSPLRTIDPRRNQLAEQITEPERDRRPAVVHADYEEDAISEESPVRPVSAVLTKSNETWEASLKRAIDGLSITTRGPAQSTDDLHERLRLRLLELAAGRHDAALMPIDGLSREEQDYWSKQLFALATLLDHQAQPDQKRRASAASVQLADAAGELSEMCPLTVRNLTFCSQIQGYGAYEPLAVTTFSPGQRLSLYAEVDNFHSVSTPQGYHTALNTSYQILDSTGNRIDGNDFPTIDDYCLRRRRDFHTQYGITLPNQLSPGKYQLQLTVKDQHAHKLGHATVDFDVAR